MNFNLLTELHLEFVVLKGGCIGSSESTLVKIPHCRKSHVAAHYVHGCSKPVIVIFVLIFLTAKQMYQYIPNRGSPEQDRSSSCSSLYWHSSRSEVRLLATDCRCLSTVMYQQNLLLGTSTQGTRRCAILLLS